MKKFALVFLFISFCITGCASQVSYTSVERSDILQWAKQIATHENDAELVMQEFNSLAKELSTKYPSDNELSQLTMYYNLISYMYNELSQLNPPSEALSTHKNYVENYAKASDAILFYTIAVRQNDIEYFERSVAATKEGNRIGDKAYSGFIEILDQYSISCDEIDYCE